MGGLVAGGYIRLPQQKVYALDINTCPSNVQMQIMVPG